MANTETGCQACSHGTFKEQRGNATCTACPAHSTTLDTGTTRQLDCVCTAGFSGDNGTACTACAIGSYKTAAGSAECTLCPDASSTPHTGSAEFANCSCNAGFTGSLLVENQDECEACPRNTFKPETGAAPCSACPAGSLAPRGSAARAACLCNRRFSGDPSVGGIARRVCRGRARRKMAPRRVACELNWRRVANVAVEDYGCVAGTEPRHTGL